MFSKQEVFLCRDAKTKKNHSFKKLLVLKFCKKPHVVQFLNGGFKLITVSCKPCEDREISEVVMSELAELLQNYKDLVAYVVNGSYSVGLIPGWEITFSDTGFLFFVIDFRLFKP